MSFCLIVIEGLDTQSKPDSTAIVSDPLKTPGSGHIALQ
jgi:hypothetical protein